MYSVLLVLAIAATFAIVTVPLLLQRKTPAARTCPSFADCVSSDVRPNQPAQTAPAPSPVAEFQLYEGDGFLFRYPSDMKILSRQPGEIIWSAEYNPGEARDYQMALTWRPSAFPEPSVGADFPSVSGYLVHVTSIEESHQIALANKNAHSFIINCGVHCYWHLIRFVHAGSHYELSHDIAGGGLETRFQTILESFQFTSD